MTAQQKYNVRLIVLGSLAVACNAAIWFAVAWEGLV